MTATMWLATAAAGFTCSWIVSPPVSTAGRAAWSALVIGFLASASLLAFDHRAVLVIALPIAALSAPLAVIRRHRSGSQTQEVPATHARLFIALSGSMLFALGVNLVVLNNQSRWAWPVLLTGAALVSGTLPFHRPSTETLRAAPADIRAPAACMLGPALWIPLARWTPDIALATTLPLLTLWLAAFLILARGDIPRLSSAALLFALGQVGTAAASSPPAAVSVAMSASSPVVLVVLLLARLERTSETREIAELGGLARRLPRFSAALLAAVFWLIGSTAAAPVWSLLELAVEDRPVRSIGRAVITLWAVYVPHVIALCGWTAVLRDLLAGPARSPLFPEPLRDRVTMPPAERTLADLNWRELTALAGFALISLAL